MMRSTSLVNDDVGEAVHLRELFTVQRSHQLPRPGDRGDVVLRHRHRGVLTHIAEENRNNIP